MMGQLNQSSKLKSWKQLVEINIPKKLKLTLGSNEDTGLLPKGQYLQSASAFIFYIYYVWRRTKIWPCKWHSTHRTLRSEWEIKCSESFCKPCQLCAVWWRNNMLESWTYIKKRYWAKVGVFYLLPLRVEVAERIWG